MDSVIGKGKWGFPVTNACHLQKETSDSERRLLVGAAVSMSRRSPETCSNSSFQVATYGTGSTH